MNNVSAGSGTSIFIGFISMILIAVCGIAIYFFINKKLSPSPSTSSWDNKDGVERGLNPKLGKNTSVKKSVDDCAEWCRNIPNAAYFNYEKKSSTCWCPTQDEIPQGPSDCLVTDKEWSAGPTYSFPDPCSGPSGDWVAIKGVKRGRITPDLQSSELKSSTECARWCASQATASFSPTWANYYDADCECFGDHSSSSMSKCLFDANGWIALNNSQAGGGIPSAQCPAADIVLSPCNETRMSGYPPKDADEVSLGADKPADTFQCAIDCFRDHSGDYTAAAWVTSDSSSDCHCYTNWQPEFQCFDTKNQFSPNQKLDFWTKSDQTSWCPSSGGKVPGCDPTPPKGTCSDNACICQQSGSPPYQNYCSVLDRTPGCSSGYHPRCHSSDSEDKCNSDSDCHCVCE